MRTSPPSILKRAPAYRPIITHWPFSHQGPAGNLSLWIRACLETYDALLVVDPKRQKLKIAEEQLQTSQKILLEK